MYHRSTVHSDSGGYVSSAQCKTLCLHEFQVPCLNALDACAASAQRRTTKRPTSRKGKGSRYITHVVRATFVSESNHTCTLRDEVYLDQYNSCYQVYCYFIIS